MLDIEKARAHLDRHLRRKEGEKLAVYRCIAGRPTIGVGATTYPGGRKVTMQDPPITVERMNEMLRYEVVRYTDEVLRMVNQNCTTSQLVALCLLGYNIGLGGLSKSTVIRKHNQGDFSAAANAFRMWNQITNPKTGKREESAALLARRMYEATIYLADTAGSKTVPQVVAPETKLIRSPIAQMGAAAVSIGAGVIGNAPERVDVAVLPAVAAQTSEVVLHANSVASAFGVNLWVLAGIVLVVCGGVAMYFRWKQRDQGYA